MNRNLTCGCCGKAFIGTQSSMSDKGFGMCERCTQVDSQKSDEILDRLITRIEYGLSKENLQRFRNKTLDEKRSLALKFLRDNPGNWKL